MTANAMQGDREKCIEAGMNDYISKPITLESLSKILNKWSKTDKPDFDYNGILSAFSSDMPLIIELAQYFIDQIPKKVEELITDINNKDLVSAREKSHSLKGAFGNLCTTRLYELALKSRN
jgi:CheY-like chemotaxis protein